MKIIDLLNKIVNGEEVPKKIKYRNKIFIYDKDNQCYVDENYNEYYDLHMSLSNHKGSDLNYEIEILEEENKIEKLKWNEKSQHNVVTDNTKKTLEHLLSRSEQLKKCLNKVIDEINKLKEKIK